MKKLSLIIFINILFSINLFSQDWDKLFEDADKKIKRVTPDSLIGLPQNIKQFLTENKYYILQCGSLSNSFCKGDFIQKGRMDWAVVASKNFRSRILVFQEGRTSAEYVYQIREREDKDYITGNPGNKDNPQFHFSRYIIKATIEDIYQAYNSFDSDITLPKIIHSGINDIFDGTGSVIFYYHNGKWLEIVSAD